MAPEDTQLRPLQALRESATAIEAAVLLCLAKPSEKSVHKLRTSTRRIEAQLELLGMLDDLPPHDKPKQKAMRLLKKLRRAAGDVRDLDVQRDLVEQESCAEDSESEAAPELRKEVRRLERGLKRRREREAGTLVEVLRKQHTQIPLVFEKLLNSLSPAEPLELSEADLTGLIRNWYLQHVPGAAPAVGDIERLHDIRKKAKLARYLAESAPQSATRARRLAARFEDVQQAGGEWHDWLLLAAVARGELGKKAQLPQRFGARAESALGGFERRIEKLNSRPSPRVEAGTPASTRGLNG